MFLWSMVLILGSGRQVKKYPYSCTNKIYPKQKLNKQLPLNSSKSLVMLEKEVQKCHSNNAATTE